MATKQVGLRVGEKAFENLDYLAKVTGKSQAQVVADLVNDLTRAIAEGALRTNPELRNDPDFHEFRMHNSRGPIITTEEQRVWRAIQRHWTAVAEHGLDTE